jgi:hypothetical protein
MNYVKVWAAHGFAQQGGRTRGREYLVSWWCSSPAKVASGEWRSRAAATVAGTPGMQRADAVPEMVARTLGPRWCSTERSPTQGSGAASGWRTAGDRPRARRVQGAGQRNARRYLGRDENGSDTDRYH